MSHDIPQAVEIVKGKEGTGSGAPGRCSGQRSRNLLMLKKDGGVGIKFIVDICFG